MPGVSPGIQACVDRPIGLSVCADSCLTVNYCPCAETISQIAGVCIYCLSTRATECSRHCHSCRNILTCVFSVEPSSGNSPSTGPLGARHEICQALDRLGIAYFGILYSQRATHHSQIWCIVTHQHAALSVEEELRILLQGRVGGVTRFTEPDFVAYMPRRNLTIL